MGDTELGRGQHGGPLRASQLVQLGLMAVLVVLLMAAVVAADAVSARIPDTGYLTRDPTSVAKVPWWAGSVSRITNLIWTAAATLTVLAGLVVRPPLRLLLLLLGGLMAALTLDDTLLLHDAVLPGRGIPELLVVGTYAVSGVALAVLWWPQRRTAAGIAFYLGCLSLGLSLVIDVLFSVQYVPEDGTKLLGALIWGLCGWWAFQDGLGRLRGDRPASAASLG